MKRFAFALLYRIGAARLAAWLNRRRVMILCYHGVTERQERSPSDPDGLHVRAARFASQLDYLRSRYHVISLEEYLSARSEGRELPPYSLILTFDDGYRNFMTAAAPQLRQRRLPATIFLITDRVRNGDLGSTQRPESWTASDDESFLSWDEAAELMRARAFQFGSHTCSHPKLTTLAPDEAERELRESQAQINEHLNLKHLTLAYPYGDYSDALARRARQLGYTCALTTDEGANDSRTDVFKLKRVLVGDDDDKAAFAARVSGLIGLLRRGAGGGGYAVPAPPPKIT